MCQAGARGQECPARPPPGAEIANPFDLLAAGGGLKAAFTLRRLEMAELPLKICYAYDSGAGIVEAPTLRVAPGDRLDIALTDLATPGGTKKAARLVFDGLARPEGTPPGMYLYHPPLTGAASVQMGGGAAGVLIVGGMERAKPEVAGLAERILVFRQLFDDAEAADGDSWLSLNFVPIGYRRMPPPVIRMRPGAREFWRVANASPGAFLALRVLFGDAAQRVRMVARDGVPVRAAWEQTTIELPPGGRAEFIVPGPAAGQAARLVQARFDTGPVGVETAAQDLARIVAAPDARVPPAILPGSGPISWNPRAAAELAERRSDAGRGLYFAEAPLGSNGPTRFMLTVEGQSPRVFDPAAAPAIMTHEGAVEDWTIANHSGEAHVFSLSGMHFLLLAEDGRRLPDPEMRDTVTVPAWRGGGIYPTVTLRLAFGAAGSHIAECPIVRHAEAGMMARVQVAAKH